MNIARLALSIPLGTLMLTACASADGTYPSLAKRDFERTEGQFEPVTAERLDVPAIPIEFDGTLDSHLVELLSGAQDAHRDFAAKIPAAQSRVRAAMGSSVESNEWALAQIALADLDSHRSRTAIVLGELDTLFAAAAVQYEHTPAIAQTRAQVAALVLQEDAVLADLRGNLR